MQIGGNMCTLFGPNVHMVGMLVTHLL